MSCLASYMADVLLGRVTRMPAACDESYLGHNESLRCCPWSTLAKTASTMPPSPEQWNRGCEVCECRGLQLCDSGRRRMQPRSA